MSEMGLAQFMQGVNASAGHWQPDGANPDGARKSIRSSESDFLAADERLDAELLGEHFEANQTPLIDTRKSGFIY